MTTLLDRPLVHRRAGLAPANGAVSPYRPIPGLSYLQTRLADTTTPGRRPPVCGCRPAHPTDLPHSALRPTPPRDTIPIGWTRAAA